MTAVTYPGSGGVLYVPVMSHMKSLSRSLFASLVSNLGFVFSFNWNTEDNTLYVDR